MNCDHVSVIKLTASSGKTKAFCADCLWEVSRPAAVAAPAMAPGDVEPYNQENVRLLMSGDLTVWEKDFLSSLGKMRQITEKQAAVWSKIVKKYFPKGMGSVDAPKHAIADDLSDVPF